jgi:thioredoxin-related protein
MARQVRTFSSTILIALALFSSTLVIAEEIPMAKNLPGEASAAEDKGMVYLLYVSRSECPYCKRLEKNVLSPMRVSNAYVNTVDLRELSYEGIEVVDFDHETRPSIDIVRKFGVIGTPTLLFLNGSGTEIAERIIGYHSEDFYWYYFEQAIETALQTMNR